MILLNTICVLLDVEYIDELNSTYHSEEGLVRAIYAVLDGEQSVAILHLHHSRLRLFLLILAVTYHGRDIGYLPHHILLILTVRWHDSVPGKQHFRVHLRLTSLIVGSLILVAVLLTLAHLELQPRQFIF